MNILHGCLSWIAWIFSLSPLLSDIVLKTCKCTYGYKKLAVWYSEVVYSSFFLFSKDWILSEKQTIVMNCSFWYVLHILSSSVSLNCIFFFTRWPFASKFNNCILCVWCFSFQNEDVMVFHRKCSIFAFIHAWLTFCLFKISYWKFFSGVRLRLFMIAQIYNAF